MVAFGSGRGMSVSENSAAGTRPSVFWPRSTTTPCSVYATTFTSIISFCAAGSWGSPYCSINLLISSEPAASSSAARALADAAVSGSVAVVAGASCAEPCTATCGAGADACSGRGTPLLFHQLTAIRAPSRHRRQLVEQERRSLLL